MLSLFQQKHLSRPNLISRYQPVEIHTRRELGCIQQNVVRSGREFTPDEFLNFATQKIIQLQDDMAESRQLESDGGTAVKGIWIVLVEQRFGGVVWRICLQSGNQRQIVSRASLTRLPIVENEI
jgi:hypothetical protein